jgi:hypothetical protein
VNTETQELEILLHWYDRGIDIANRPNIQGVVHHALEQQLTKHGLSGAFCFSTAGVEYVALYETKGGVCEVSVYRKDKVDRGLEARGFTILKAN